MARRTEYAASSSSGNRGQSVVEDFGVSKSPCGYCKSTGKTSIVHGLVAYNLTVDDYQDLLDRGWRRSGAFLYKHEMERTCCPPYTIRLKADRFVPSKEQMRVRRRMERFLDGTYDGLRNAGDAQKEDNVTSGRLCSMTPNVSLDEDVSKISAHSKESSAAGRAKLFEIDEAMRNISSKIDNAVKSCAESGELAAGINLPQAAVKKSTAQMKKKLKGLCGDLEYTSNIAFEIAALLNRMHIPENMESPTEVSLDGKPLKHRSLGISPMAIADKLASKLQTFGELSGLSVQACNGYLNFISPSGPQDSTQNFPGETSVVKECTMFSPRKIEVENKRDATVSTSGCCQHHKKRKLEIRMNRSSFDPEEFALYKKYQIKVHNDKPEEVRESSYRRFLVDTPVIFVPPTHDNTVSPCGFGSFHQQYLIDGQLVAVGVVDILPRCLSSKYLFWDPDLAFLSLGKYSALEEIKFVQENQKHCPTLQYYYLGYYIHSCPKMRYKAAYNPSELLCPVRYQWIPFRIAKPLLDRISYVCLSDFSRHGDPISYSAKDSESINDESATQVDQKMEDAFEMHDMGLDAFQSSGSSDDSVGLDEGTEASSGELATEDISDGLIHWNGLLFRFKELQTSAVLDPRFIDLCSVLLRKYVKVVGTELAGRLAYSLS